MLVRVNGLMLGKFMSTLNPTLHLKLPVDVHNGARNILVSNILKWKDTVLALYIRHMFVF